jgi:hypothetical protein
MHVALRKRLVGTAGNTSVPADLSPWTEARLHSVDMHLLSAARRLHWSRAALLLLSRSWTPSDHPQVSYGRNADHVVQEVCGLRQGRAAGHVVRATGQSVSARG